MIDNYVYIIVALLPLSAVMLVLQKNPYHALVIRAILGAIAVLVYIVLGAGDVALTEALVGTMLAVTLYVIAVRSSLVMRLGIVAESYSAKDSYLLETLADLKKVIHRYHLRLELVEYADPISLQQALKDREVHAAIEEKLSAANPEVMYQTAIRVKRLFEIMTAELAAPNTSIVYTPIANQEKKH